MGDDITIWFVPADGEPASQATVAGNGDLVGAGKRLANGRMDLGTTKELIDDDWFMSAGFDEQGNLTGVLIARRGDGR